MTPRVVIVEDEAIPALELTMRLERWGYEVVSPEANGSDAVHAVRLHRPDLVIMDVVMPGPLDGIAAAEVIQLEFGLPVLFLTAVAERVPPSRGASFPRLVVTKPYNPDDLYQAIGRLLRHP
ncbi:MAG: response regulator [Spirochaetota bacterium]